MSDADKTSPVEDDAILKNLAEVFMEHLRQEANHFEPFDAYTQRLKLKLYRNFDHFYNRFVNGYHILVKEVKDLPPLPDLNPKSTSERGSHD